MLRKNSRATLCLAFLALVPTLVVVGCSDDDDSPTDPTTLPGTAVITPSPAELSAPWTLTKPDGSTTSGAGGTTMEELELGTYILRWDDVAGYITPAFQTRNVHANETVAFSAVYIQDLPGTVVVAPWPEGITAPWTLDGPSGDTLEGSGLTTIPDLALGEYSLTWHDVSEPWDGAADWLVPPGQVLSVSYGQTITFVGAYTGFEAIEPGTFTMGSPEEEPGRSGNEVAHAVQLTEGFLMSRHEVTSRLWSQVMGDGSSMSQLPEVRISWDDAVEFCNRMSEAEGLEEVYNIREVDGDVTWLRDNRGYRLPTEAEWEYACRAGTATAFSSGAITVPEGCGTVDPVLDLAGWYCGNAVGRRMPVAQKEANLWNLYDMHGNASEWCWDRFVLRYENIVNNSQEFDVDPVANGGEGDNRVLHGGYWSNEACRCRAASRSFGSPAEALSSAGLRLVRDLP